jgi:uncharacterized membrane protein YuzA (DUF378 family)
MPRNIFVSLLSLLLKEYFLEATTSLTQGGYGPDSRIIKGLQQMLTNVPSAVNRMARNVVINHPNAFNCQVFRKTVTRAGDVVSGLPELGGLGVLSSEDEEQYTYAWVGNGYSLQVEAFQPALMMDRRDANNGLESEFKFLIEAEDAAGMPGAFEPKKFDVMYLLLGDGPNPAKVAFEIVGIEAMLNIPPYTSRYIANRRDDLHVAAGQP